MFCQNCGARLEQNARFCENCGAAVAQAAQAQQPAQPVQYTAPVYNQAQAPMYYPQPKKAANGLLIGIVGLLILVLLTVAAFVLFGTKVLGWVIAVLIWAILGVIIAVFSKKGIGLTAVALVLGLVITVGAFFVGTDINSVPAMNTNSSVVSKGVNKNDLGNILNGQYYFDDGKNQYYSSFDTDIAAHIYKAEKGKATATPIFDGFGWSLVVNDGWLYFSGNAGDRIDDTYNLFRIRTDGTGLTKLSTGFCYGMNIYKQWLYYVKQDNRQDTTADICRCTLDGKDEQVVAANCGGNFIIYDNLMYYTDTSGNIYKASPDGTESSQIISGTVTRFIIGNGRIIYTNGTGIKTAKPDGTDIQQIRPDGTKIGAVNSYKNYIYYVEYDPNSFNNDTYSYPYSLHRIGFDGKDDQQVYQSNSWGFYVNLLNEKVYVLDYTRSGSSSNMCAIVHIMDKDGGNIKELYR